MRLALGLLLLAAQPALAGQISGDYLEARTCDVFTGPCFANAEMSLGGKEAVMAWRVDEGGWNNINLQGLTVAVVTSAEWTIGDTGVFKYDAGKMTSVILVDDKASPEQRVALVNFAKTQAAEYTQNVARVQPVTMSFENDHLAASGKFQAGELASIETRALKKGDCVCTNEEMYYQPLTKARDITPAYTSTLSYTGDALNTSFTSHGQRSAFLGTFRR